MGSLQITSVSKYFGTNQVLRDVSLSVEQGEFMSATNLALLEDNAHIGHGAADSRIGLNVPVQAGLGYLRHHDRNAPRVGLFGRASLAHGCAPAFSGKGNRTEPLTSAGSSALSSAAITASA